jgi:type IV pilus assembly protein PilM
MPTLPAWLKTPPPTLGLHLDAQRVTAVLVDRDGASPMVRSVASTALPAGALVPSLTAHNVLQSGVVVQAVRELLEQVGGRHRRVALAIPDTAAKVSLVPFEQVPTSARDLEQLIRLQLRKTVPFPVEDAQVAWTHGGPQDGATTLVVTAMRRDIVREYEAVCAAAGLHAGTVDLATFNVMNLALIAGGPGSGLPGDTLLVHVTATYASIALMRDGALIFFRTRHADAAEPVADVVHQTRMFYEDRLGGRGFTRVLLVAGPDVPDREALSRNLGTLFDAPVAPLVLDGIVGFGDRVAASDRVVGQIAAPAGIVLREGVA